MFSFPMTPRQVDVFQRPSAGMCGTGTAKGRAEGCVLAHGPRGLGVRGAQTALPGRAGRAEPARHASRREAAGALAAVTGRAPPSGSVVFSGDRSSASSPRPLPGPGAPVPTGGTILGSLCPRCGGEAGRSAAWQGFVLPEREQGDETETFEGS